MKLLPIIFFIFAFNLSYAQTGRFHFKAEVEWGYLMKGEKHFAFKDIPSLTSLKLGVEAHAGKKGAFGLFLNTAYIQSVLSSGKSLTFPSNPSNPSPGANEAYYVLSIKAILLGPTAFISYGIYDKLKLEFQFSYMKYGFMTGNHEYLYFVNDKKKEPTSRLTDLKLNSHSILQLLLPYQIYKGEKIALSVKPFYAFHFIHGSLIDTHATPGQQAIVDNLEIVEDKNMHSIGIGLAFTLL